MARILVAEDEEAVRAFVERALTASGHEVVAVEHGGAALETLEEEPFDLLLTDIRMPVMDGIALALKVSTEFPGLPIIMMTGYVAEKQRAHNLDLIIDEVISKPFTLDQINTAINRALALRRPNS